MAESKDFDACAVCGRTILRGERITEYVTQDGARVGVCSLCKQAAENAGWVPAELASTGGQGTETRRRGLGLRERLARASEAARALRARPARDREEKAESPAPEARPRPSRPTEHETPRTRERGGRPGGREESEESGDDENAGSRGDQPGRSPAGESERSAARPQTKPPPRSREQLLRLGVERFNASSGPRKVAGLIRSLGEPQVAVRVSRGGTIVVTVAWELSWYQWEVRADRNGDGVREARKGDEVSELGSHDRSWNAKAASDGKVRLELVAARGASAQLE